MTMIMKNNNKTNQNMNITKHTTRTNVLEIGKCYSIRAFESPWSYKILVTKIEPNGGVHASYRTRINNTNKKQRKYKYMFLQHDGYFDNVVIIRKIKSL